MDIPSLQATTVTASVGAMNSSTNKMLEVESSVISTADQYTSIISGFSAKYNPTRISLDQITDLGNDLYNNGFISGSDHAMMIGLPNFVNLLAKDGQSITNLKANSDGSVNLLDFWKNLVDSQDKNITSTDISNLVNSFDNKNPNNLSTSNLNLSSNISTYNSAIKSSMFDAQRVFDILNAISSNNI